MMNLSLSKGILILFFYISLTLSTADTNFTFVHRPKARTSASIILRGANDFLLDEMERSLHDSLCVIKRVLESKSVVPGGGAVEAAVSIYLENFATSLVSYFINGMLILLTPELHDFLYFIVHIKLLIKNQNLCGLFFL